MRSGKTLFKENGWRVPVFSESFVLLQHRWADGAGAMPGTSSATKSLVVLLGGLSLVGTSSVGKMSVFCKLREATSPAPDVC